MLEVTLGRSIRIPFLCLSVLIAVLLSSCGLAMDSEDRLDRAAEAIENGEYRAAIIDAKDVLRKEPDNARGRLLLGRASLEIGDGASAEKELRRAMEFGTDAGLLIVDLGRAMLQQRKPQQVLDEITPDLAASDDDRLAVLRLRANATQLLGRPAEAREIYTSVLAENPDDVEAKLGVVSTYMAQKNFLQARATMELLLGSNPDNMSVWISSGMLNFQVRDFESAEENFRRALSLLSAEDMTESSIQAYSGLADALLAQDKFEDAIEVVAKLDELAPNSIPAMHLAARIAYLDEDWPVAQEKLQRVLRIAPQYWPAQLLLGAVQLRSGNPVQAEMYFSAVVAAVPENSQARQLLAETRLQMARLEEAQQALQPIIGDSTDPRSLSLAARASMGLGKTDDAVGFLLQSLAANPGNVELQFQLVITYLSAGRRDEAQDLLRNIEVGESGEGEFRRDALLVSAKIKDGGVSDAIAPARALAEKWPDTGRAHTLLGSLLLIQGNSRGARESLETGAELSSYDVISRLYLAVLEEAEGNLQDARNHYLAILEEAPDATWASMALALIARQEGDTAESLRRLEDIRAAVADAVPARLMLVKQYLRDKNFDSATEVVREVIDIDATIDEAHNLLGYALSNLQDFRGAANSFRRAVELDTSVADYRLNLARAQLELGNDTLAQQTLESDKSQYLSHIPSGVFLATMRADNGDMPGAFEIARELQAAHPNSPLPHAVEGELHVRAGDLESASKAYDTALDIDPNRIHALRSYNLKSRMGGADWEQPLQNFLEKRPLDAGVRMVLASALDQAGEGARAIAEFERVVADEPDNAVALNNLAWDYFVAGDSRAEATARRAYEIAPDIGSIADTLGWILLQNGSIEDGVELLRDAVQLTSSSPEVRYHLAVGLSKAGQIEEARRTLEEILASDENFASRDEARNLLAQL